MDNEGTNLSNATRRSSKMPQRNKSYTTVDENGNTKIADMVLSALHTFASISTWLPLIIMFCLPGDFKLAVVISTAIAAFNLFIVNLILYKWNKTRSWPKTLDVIFFLVFLTMTIAVWAFPQTSDFFRFFSGAIIFAFNSIGVIIAWLFGHPFIKQFFADEIDPIALTHPMTILFIRFLTGMWLGIFIACTIISLPAGIINLKHGDEAAETALMVAYILPIILSVSGIIFGNFIFPAYYFANMEKFAGPYEQEIEEWMVKNPDHEYTKNYEDTEERDVS